MKPRPAFLLRVITIISKSHCELAITQRWMYQAKMSKIRLVKIDPALVAANEENYNPNFHTEGEAPGEPIPSESL